MRETARTEILDGSSVEAIQRLEEDHSERFEQPAYLEEQELVRKYRFRRSEAGRPDALGSLTIEVFEDERYRVAGDLALIDEYFPEAEIE